MNTKDASANFGDVIYSYTRAQALEDGVLADVSKMAREAGIKYPVAITSRLYETLNHVSKGSFQSFEGRLWDVLWMMSLAMRRGSGDTIYFKVKVGRKYLNLWAKCGPGDDMSPVITVMFTDED